MLEVKEKRKRNGFRAREMGDSGLCETPVHIFLIINSCSLLLWQQFKYYLKHLKQFKYHLKPSPGIQLTFGLFLQSQSHLTVLARVWGGLEAEPLDRIWPKLYAVELQQGLKRL